MESKMILLFVLVALALAEEKKDAAEADPTKNKRGLYDLGYGYAGQQSHLVAYSSLPEPSLGASTVITKEVPLPQAYSVSYGKPVPIAVKVPYPVPVDRPYPVEVTKHVPVPVDRPYPVAVKVHVPAPYPVKVPQPYPVEVIKHVGVPISQPIVIDKANSGWSSSYSYW